MTTIPVILYPVIAFLLAVVGGRIGTLIMAQFRKDEEEMTLVTNNQASAPSDSAAVAKHS